MFIRLCLLALFVCAPFASRSAARAQELTPAAPLALPPAAQPYHVTLTPGDRELQLERRLVAIEVREHELRSAFRVGPLVGSAVVAGAGILTSVVCLLIAANNTLDYDEEPARLQRNLRTVQLVTIPITLGAIALTLGQLIGRPHRDELRELSRERGLVTRDLKRLRRSLDR